MIGALLVIALGTIVGFGIALALRARREFAVQNEVVPGRRSPAPASWAGAHTRAAKLHRRLGSAVRGAAANPNFVEHGLAPQMRAIENQAMAIDERLVAAANLAEPHRTAAIDELEHQVDELEATIADLVVGVSLADSRALLAEAVDAADERLEALARARAEVEALDAPTLGVADAPDDEAGAAESTTAPR